MMASAFGGWWLVAGGWWLAIRMTKVSRLGGVIVQWWLVTKGGWWLVAGREKSDRRKCQLGRGRTLQQLRSFQARCTIS